MVKHALAVAMSLMMSGFAVAATSSNTDSAAAAGDAADVHAEALRLCERLGGTEHDVCVRQARENAAMAAPDNRGATPGTGGSGTVHPQVPTPPSTNSAKPR